MRVSYIAGLLIAGTISSAVADAQAQQAPAEPSLAGTWSGYFQAKQGVVAVTAQYRSDGTFDAVMLGPVSGYPLPIYEHLWGHYRTQPAGPLRYNLEMALSGHAPSEICQSTPAGAPIACRPFGGFGATYKGYAQFVSVNSFRDETGAVFTRISEPGLLAQRVPARLVIAPPAPPDVCGADGTTSPCSQPPIPPMEPVRCEDGKTLVYYPDGRRKCLKL